MQTETHVGTYNEVRKKMVARFGGEGWTYGWRWLFSPEPSAYRTNAHGEYVIHIRDADTP
jgi:hypothetical protein